MRRFRASGLISAVVVGLFALTSGCRPDRRPGAVPLASAEPSQTGQVQQVADATSLAALRDRATPASRVTTIQIPQHGSVVPWTIPTRGLLLTAGDRNGFYELALLNIADGKTGRKIVWDEPGPGMYFYEAGTDRVVTYYSTGLEVLTMKGSELSFTGIKAPSVGPGYPRSGQNGNRLYVVPRDLFDPQKPFSYYYVFRVGSSKALEKVDVGAPYRGFTAASGTDTVLLSCPGLRLVRGKELIWQYKSEECARDWDISDDGTIAWGMFPGPDATQVLRVFGEGGELLWEQRLRPATEDVKFAHGGKRFWMRLHDDSDKTILRLVDAQGQKLGQWEFPLPEDNVKAVSTEGNQALLQVGDDLLVLSDQGQVQLRCTARRAANILRIFNDGGQFVYLVDESNRQVQVFEIPKR